MKGRCRKKYPGDVSTFDAAAGKGIERMRVTRGIDAREPGEANTLAGASADQVGLSA